MVKIKFFTLLKLYLGLDEIEINLEKETTLLEILKRVIEKIGEEKGKIFKEKIFENPQSLDRLKEGVMILVNGKNVLDLEGLETIVKPGDQVSIFPPGGGG